MLRKAAELANRVEPLASSSSGLTLTEMKAVAAQVGFDPALIERAARIVSASTDASPLTRLCGGPLHHHQTARFPVALDEIQAARLLSAVRIGVGVAGARDVGHSSAMGMTWHDGGELESLGITARPEGDGTAVSIAVDRRGTLGVVAMASGITMILTVFFCVFGLYPEAPALGVGGLVVGTGGILALARGYWASSTRKLRERISAAMELVGQTLGRREAELPEVATDGESARENSRHHAHRRELS